MQNSTPVVESAINNMAVDGNYHLTVEPAKRGPIVAQTLRKIFPQQCFPVCACKKQKKKFRNRFCFSETENGSATNATCARKWENIQSSNVSSIMFRTNHVCQAATQGDRDANPVGGGYSLV